ncbi:MAG TPA: sigma-54 dependent transcriptional regulator [Terriglobia bacterium]|jgi:DNA-binding NtrC family response regulator|nr:sigma-54 dependent transcriptional regulator [Terriglobia bacterium]
MAMTVVNADFSSAMIVSPDADFRRKIQEHLDLTQSSIAEAQGGAEALAKLEAGGCEALLIDRWLPDLDISDFLHIVRDRFPQVRVVAVDAVGDVKGLRQEIVISPSRDEMCSPVGCFHPKTSCNPEMDSETLPPSELLSEPVAPLPGMMGESKAMQTVYRLSRLVSSRSTTVLVTGETGTGKELVARAIHLLSPRQSQPFVTVNCAAIPEALLESELFGYARGAFTGAFQSRMGRIQAAHGGTLFLDEVGELPLSMQAKLLRFLQEGEVQRLGGPDVVRVDVRVIAATNAELGKRVAERAFREDLYYRLSVFPIDLVPLRERPEDILPLGRHFLDAFCAESRLPAKTISSSAGSLLVKHVWPGNVRELRHVMERAFILSENSTEILSEHIRLQTPWR